jgi:serine/threonine protein kinase
MYGFRPNDLIAGRFRIHRLIGRGGMGEVYDARDLAIRSTPRVALKVIRPEVSSDPKMIVRFEREIEVGKIVTHPNVCRIYDLGMHSTSGSRGHSVEILFVTMELLAGHTLAAELHERLTAGEALPLLQQVAVALDAVHDAGVVHCDLKPNNIMLLPAAGGKFPKAVLMDFGLARRIVGGGNASSGLSFVDVTYGTPDYMSPEQVTGGAIGTSSDIYSFGVLIYQMITGVMPFAGPNGATRMLKRLSEDPVPFGRQVRIPESGWETAILRCLSRDPGQRFRRASDVVGVLRHADPARIGQITSDSGLAPRSAAVQFPETAADGRLSSTFQRRRGFLGTDDFAVKPFLAYLMSRIRSMARRSGVSFSAPANEPDL